MMMIVMILMMTVMMIVVMLIVRLMRGRSGREGMAAGSPVLMSARRIDVRVAAQSLRAKTTGKVLSFQVLNAKFCVVALLQTIRLSLLETSLQAIWRQSSHLQDVKELRPAADFHDGVRPLEKLLYILFPWCSQSAVKLARYSIGGCGCQVLLRQSKEQDLQHEQLAADKSRLPTPTEPIAT